MTRERIEANSAESRQTFNSYDGVFAEAYSDKTLGSLKQSTGGRTEIKSLDFDSQDIYASAERREAKVNESNEAERVTPLAQRQRNDRIAANADVDQASTVVDKQHLLSNVNDNFNFEPKMNEACEAERVTPLAQRQRNDRIAANADQDQMGAVKEREKN